MEIQSLSLNSVWTYLKWIWNGESRLYFSRQDGTTEQIGPDCTWSSPLPSNSLILNGGKRTSFRDLDLRETIYFLCDLEPLLYYKRSYSEIDQLSNVGNAALLMGILWIKRQLFTKERHGKETYMSVVSIAIWHPGRKLHFTGGTNAVLTCNRLSKTRLSSN